MTQSIKNIGLALTLLVMSLSCLAIQQQQRDNWCWAASIQTVMEQAGVYRNQEQIVSRLTGYPQNRPAHINEVVRLLKSYNFRSWQAGAPGSPQQLYNTLNDGWKIIAFVRPNNGNIGHFIVLEKIDHNSGGVWVSDPWTGKTNLNSLQSLYSSWRWADSIIVGIPMN